MTQPVSFATNPAESYRQSLAAEHKLTARCPWCRDPESEYEPSDPERELCHSHYLEYDGLSEDSYQEMLAGERYDRM
jgi:hypothetical protein